MSGDQKRSDGQEPGFCWAVVFSNYEPAEVDTLFATKALAEERAEQLGDGWNTERWAIQGWRGNEPLPGKDAPMTPHGRRGDL